MSRALLVLGVLVPGLAWAAETPLSQMSFAGSPLSMMGMLALMSLLPFAVLMLTSFSKIAVVLSLARSAMGTQQAPPTIVLTGLAAVLTGHIMAPVMERMYDVGQVVYEDTRSGAQILSAAGK
ncbi:MAG TPA: EscR/YscR/HrcR family type III secretion system export apparatus protein, partial [Archangium sp.]|nr:EscR/YscR/HrcR family type III secretion system export apparatus protein [Archangium sp.]